MADVVDSNCSCLCGDFAYIVFVQRNLVMVVTDRRSICFTKHRVDHMAHTMSSLLTR